MNLDLGSSLVRLADRAAVVPRVEVKQSAVPRVAGRAPGILGGLVNQVGQRYFQAAQDNRFTYGMASVPLSADQVTRQGLTRTRARSRQEAAINDYGKRFLDIIDANVVGPNGFALQPQYENDDETPDDTAARVMMDAWREWGHKENCDLSTMLTWLQLEKLVMRNVAIDGEIFLRVVSGKGVNQFNFALEVIDPEWIRVEDNRELANGNVVSMGIEYDPVRRPVAYWVVIPDQYTGWMGQGYYGGDAVRVPADRMIHVFEPVRVGQRRGWPWMSTSLMRLALLEGLEDAALIAARIGANKVAWVRDNNGGTWTGDGFDSSGVEFLSGEAGEIGKLRQGQEVVSWDPQYPNGELGPFAAHLLRGLASGLGAPYVSLSNDLSGVNYSSIRAGMLEARDLYRGKQTWLSAELHRQVFKRWLTVQIISGTLRFPSGKEFPIRKFDKWAKVYWRPRGYEWVDPLKEAQADEIAIARGTKTESESIRNRGGDPEAVWRERAYEIKRKQKLGLPPGPEGAMLLPASPDNEEAKSA